MHESRRTAGAVSSGPLRVFLAIALAVALATPAIPASARPYAAATIPVLAPVSPVASTSAAASDDSGLVIVKPRAGRSITSLAGARNMRRGIYVLPAPKGQTGADYAATLARDPNVEYAVPDYIRHVLAYTATPNDPDFTNATSRSFTWGGVTAMLAHAKSWWLRGTGSPNFDAVWPYLTPDGAAVAYDARATGAQVKVAVIDTGFYFNHADKGSSIVAGKDLFATYNGGAGVRTTDDDVTPVSPGAPRNDNKTASHGTMTASEIAQGTNNGVGGAGAAYDTQVRVYKVQGLWIDGNPDLGYPAGSAIILDDAVNDAIRLAADDGCRVISMSIGGVDYSPAMQDAIDYAYAKGAVIVAATGNDGSGEVSYPAANDHVMGVGAYTLTGGGGSVPATVPAKDSSSNWGTGNDILAPGDHVWGPTTPGWDADGFGSGSIPGYTWWDGTSMAAPLVASAAALTLRLAPNLGVDDVVDLVQSSAVDMGTPGYDLTNGWGKLDMAAAYGLLKAEYPNLAKPAVTGIVSGASYRERDFSLAWPAVPGFSVQYVVSSDGSTLSTSSATTISLSDLADGPHALTITPISARNWSAGSAVTVTFTVDNAAPAAPTVTYDSTSHAIAWTTPETGGTTEFAIDGTSVPIAVAGGRYALTSDTPDGAHTAYVRVTDAAGNVGAWGVADFLLDTVAPAEPVLTWNPADNTLGWTLPEAGGTTQLAVDSVSAPVTVPGTSYTMTLATPDGSHTAYARSLDAAGNASDWASVAFALDRATVFAVTTPASVTVRYASRVTLSGTLAGPDARPLSGADVRLERSLDNGKTWGLLTTTITTVSGTWTASVAPGRNMIVRARYSGDAIHTPAVSTTTTLRQSVYVGTPSTSSWVTHRYSFTTHGYLKPRSKSGTHPVRVYFYRYEKQRNGTHKWVLRKSVLAQASNYSSYTKYSVRTSVPYAGKWKAIAVYAGSTTYSKTTSGSRYFTAR